MLCIDPDWPKDLKYINLNNFTCLLIEYLYKFLDIENRIKILRDKYSNKKEDVDKIDKIENEFNKVKKESLEIKEYSKGILISLKENYEKNKDIKDVKETYEEVCSGVVDNAIKYYSKFKNLIVLIDDEIKVFKE